MTKKTDTPAESTDLLTIDPPEEAPAAPPPKKATRHILSDRFADPDLVDRIFDHVLQLIPELAGADIQSTKAAIRTEFGGAQQYIRSESVDRREREIEHVVRRMFDGRNATHIARVLNISRATVYRCLKQPGRSSDDT